MKKLIWFLIVFLWCGLAWAQPRPGLIVEESGGAPSGFVYKLIVPSGNLAISSAVGTLTFGGDTDANGTIDLDELGNPGASKTFTMANYSLKFDWTTANPSSAITFVEFESEADPTDTDVVFFLIEAGGDGGTDLMKITGTATRATLTGDLTINTSQTNYSSHSNYKVNNTPFNDFHDDCGTAATLDVAADTHYGGVACNGDADAIEIDLDAAVVGMNILIVDKAGGAITLDPNGTDVIVYDGTAASAGEAIISSGAKGDFIGLICLTANEWITLGHDSNGWTEASP